MKAERSKPSARDVRIEYFDQHAATWDTAGPDPHETLRRLKAHAELLELGEGEDLLEVGCGTGQLTQWLAERVRPGQVTAIDFAPGMLEKARAKGIDADFRLADVCRDDLGAERFDAALCFHSFPHFRDKPAALAHIAAALKRGGRLIVMHLRSSAEINAFHRSVGGAVARDQLPSERQWDELLALASLQKVQVIDRPGLFCLKAVKV